MTAKDLLEIADRLDEQCQNLWKIIEMKDKIIEKQEELILKLQSKKGYH